MQVRTRLQLAETAGASYRGIWHCLTDTYGREGAAALYKGLLPSMASGVPYVGLQARIPVSSVAALQHVGSSAQKKVSMCAHVLGHEQPTSDGPKHGNRQNGMLQHAHEEAADRTSLLTWLRALPSKMTFYADLKLWLGPKLGAPGEPMSVWSMLLCGSAAGLAAQSLCYPLDTIRHRMQANGIAGQARPAWEAL